MSAYVSRGRQARACAHLSRNVGFLNAPCGEPEYLAHIGQGKGLRSPSSSGGLTLALVREDSPEDEPSSPVHPGEGDSVVAAATEKEEDKKDKNSSRRRKMKHGSSMPPDKISISGHIPVDALVEQLAMDRQKVREYKEHGWGKSEYFTEHKKTFKPSVDKSDKRVPHIATNLHVHTMYVTGDKDKEQADCLERGKTRTCPSAQHIPDISSFWKLRLPST